MVSKRKLAAILFTDIVGYTKQVSQDETRSLKGRLRVERLIKDCAASYNGRVIKTIGDAVMLDFGSAVDAVSCAITIQERMQALNDETDSTTPIQVRIGVHVGDVVEEDNDLFGNAVNIAQRIQDMAQPGGICISREVYVQIRPILKLRCDVVTAAGRKAMPEPVEVLNVTSELLSVEPERKSTFSESKTKAVGGLGPALILVSWIFFMPLWNWIPWGAPLSGFLLGVVMIAFCRQLTEFTPELRANEAYRKRPFGTKLFRLAPLTLFFVGGAVLIYSAYVSALDQFSFRGWTPHSAPWEYADDNKGQEYRLIHFLSAFQSSPPQVSLDSTSGGSLSSSDSLPGLSLVFPITMGFFFFYIGTVAALSVGQEKYYWERGPSANKRLQSLSLGISARILLTLALLFSVRDFIAATSGAMNSLDATVRCRASADTVEARLKTWVDENGFEISTYNKYALNTIPQEKKIGAAYVYRIWKRNPSDRWHFGVGGIQRLAPFLTVDMISSDFPAETVVLVSGGHLKRGSPEFPRLKGEFESIVAAFADSQASHASK